MGLLWGVMLFDCKVKLIDLGLIIVRCVKIFNLSSMTVEPRDVVHSIPSKKFVPVDNILQNFVVHVADMRFGVRKSRTIVNHPSRVDRCIVSIKLRG